jgi:hypothetical protein
MFPAAALACSLLCALPAAAQTTVPRAAASSDGGFFIGGTIGIGTVRKTAGLGGGELGFHLDDRTDVFGEGVAMQNVVTRERIDMAQRVGAFLQTSQGGAATGAVKAPAFYAGGGLRVMLMTEGRVRPFVTVGAGMARTALRPVFTLGGSDITARLPQYGVTLGSDLAGEQTNAAFSAGAGVRALQGRWYIDGGIRLINIRGAQPANVIGASAGFGLNF